MHHRGHIEIDHLFVERVPVLVRERWIGPVTAGGIGVEVAADEAEFLDAAAQLGNAVGGRNAGRLRELADTDEVIGKELADAVDDVVAELGPDERGLLIAEVMAHLTGDGREDRHVAAALFLQLELAIFDGGFEFVVGDD